MWISALRLRNFRGFADSGEIHFARRTNVLVGPNNAGKSTIIRAINSLQDTAAVTQEDIRVGETIAEFQIDLEDLSHGYVYEIQGFPRGLLDPPHIFGTIQRGQGFQLTAGAQPGQRGLPVAVNAEPNNLLYPYLSKRKAVAYSEDVHAGVAASVLGDLRYLNAKVDRLASPYHPKHEAYDRACDGILGFRVGTFASATGKKAGIVVNDTDFIPIEALGEGVSNLLGLITSLCIAQYKIFLIEEPENDIHPQALKSLLRLMLDVSESNQFILSTHSNIVTKHLGSIEESTVHYVSMEFEDRMPVSVCREVGDSPEERRAVLEELGYELFDFDLWEAWLFLEESSAERIIREYLIPWFVQELANRLRTISAGGAGRVEAKFDDFDRLFLFVHLSTVYRNRAWVVVDGDKVGRATIDRLKNRYVRGGWSAENFLPLSKEDFEEFYPPRFAGEVAAALAVEDRRQRWEAKKALLENVIQWIDQSEQQAKDEFAQSASEVIQILRGIGEALSGQPPMPPTPEAVQITTTP